jgi:hypothetical protein
LLIFCGIYEMGRVQGGMAVDCGTEIELEGEGLAYAKLTLSYIPSLIPPSFSPLINGRIAKTRFRLYAFLNFYLLHYAHQA